MAINFDHTNSASITLKGPQDGQVQDNFTFVFPNVISETAPTLLISGETPISAISGLVSALSSKVEKCTTGSAATLNYGTSIGNVVQLNEYAKIPDELISSVAIRDVFSVTSFSELTSNASASIGDVGLVSDENKNYILCSSGAGAYSNSSNWKEVLFPVQTVTSVNTLVGDVCLDGSNVNVSSAGPAAYIGYSLDYAISDLDTNKANLNALIDYATQDGVSGCFALYTNTTALTTCLGGYVTDSELSSIIADYSTTSEINTLLEDYVLNTETGSAAALYVGITSGNVVQLNEDGKIPNEVVPHLAITDVFVVGSSGDLTSLSAAQKGDVAISTGDRRNFILSQDSYSDLNHWVSFSPSVGDITGINNIAPVEGVVTLTSSNIDVFDTDTIYDGFSITNALTGLYGQISGIQSDYLTETEASDLLTSYVTTGYATGIFDIKSENGHGHGMSDVTGLVDCLSSISVFCVGDGASSAVLQGSANPHYNQALGAYSVALGQGAKAVQDYEVAQGAGIFSVPGDAQVSRLVSKCETSSDSATTIAQICMSDYSNILFSAYVIGRTSGGSAAFKVTSAANREGGANTTQILGEMSTDTYSNTNAYTIDLVANTTQGTVDIVVNADAVQSVHWVTNVNVVKVLID